MLLPAPTPLPEFLMDTNTFELLLRRDASTLRRVRANPDSVYLSSVAVEELLAGRMATLNRARAPRTPLSLPQAHEDFATLLDEIRLLPLLIYSEAAEQVYRTFPQAAIRRGSQDCRIAAQALAHNLTVVTRNTADFAAIGAPCADWSADEEGF